VCVCVSVCLWCMCVCLWCVCVCVCVQVREGERERERERKREKERERGGEREEKVLGEKLHTLAKMITMMRGRREQKVGQLDKRTNGHLDKETKKQKGQMDKNAK